MFVYSAIYCKTKSLRAQLFETFFPKPESLKVKHWELFGGTDNNPSPEGTSFSYLYYLITLLIVADYLARSSNPRLSITAFHSHVTHALKLKMWFEPKQVHFYSPSCTISLGLASAISTQLVGCVDLET
jgi:hypothetical protein